jgi:hypothetical protein
MIIARQQAKQDAIMDIGGWLRSLGLEQYEATLRANAVEADVLQDLTDQDLEKLGIVSCGRAAKVGWSLNVASRIPR